MLPHTTSTHATLDEWIRRDAIPFSVDAPESFNTVVDRVIASLGDSVEMLGFGEALHSGEEILTLRNRLFQRLAEAHGYSAIALESSLPRARLVNDYIAGRDFTSYEEVKDRGFGQGFGQLEANRELVEWMRQYNADPSHRTKLQFYGFDIPTGTTPGIVSPRPVLQLALDYFCAMDSANGQEMRQRIESLLGQDSDWENPAQYTDPTKSVGLSPAANALRIATEDLITEFRTRRPELVAKSSQQHYLESLQHASAARDFLTFHSAMARESSERMAILLGIRDASMADNLAYVLAREQGRGKVFAFAHNGHLQCGKIQMPIGSDVAAWWPAGSHLHDRLGARYAAIGSAVGVSEDNGIGRPEAGSLEARLTALSEPALFLPTHKGEGLPTTELATLPTRSSSTKNPSYKPLTAQSLSDFDWLAVLDSTVYARGGWPLSAGNPS